MDPHGYRARLSQAELYWRNHYEWLLQQGYRLRSRYHPEWVASWATDRKGNKAPEDYWGVNSDIVNDAFRLSDNSHVVLKRISKKDQPHEMKILRYFAEGDLASDPQNHCIPLLDVLQPPSDEEYEIAVFPLLRDYSDPEFDTIGEALDFIRQVLEGFAFLHKHRVAHRDVRGENILMDPQALGYPDFHFVMRELTVDAAKLAWPKYRRTQRWPRYHIIDFGFSTQYTEEEMPPYEPPLPASDNTLPELDDLDEPCNPFPVDVFYVGNWIRMDFLDGNPDSPILKTGYHGFEFLRPLVEEMTKQKPEERITMGESVARFDSLVAVVPTSNLRSYADRKGEYLESIGALVLRVLLHWVRRLLYVVQRKPPVPHWNIA